MIQKKKPKATKANLKARAVNGSLLSIIGLVVMKAEDGIRDDLVTGVQTCALPIFYVKILDPY